jgi:fructokinase
MIAAIETGGTKVFCAVAETHNPHELVDTVRIPTTTPDETLGEIARFVDRHHSAGGIDAVGVASFGPIDVNPASPHYGWITATPKIGWVDTDLHRALSGLNGVPVGFATDVSGSVLGEGALGAGTGLGTLAYITVGTGIGVGQIINGTLIGGLGTPEMGHVLIRRHPDDDFPGNCPYHRDCLEGLAAGPSIQARWGGPASGAAIGILAWYIAQLCVDIILTTSPERIVLGGGVSKTPGLIEAVRAQTRDLLNGYLPGHPITDVDSGFIVPPALGDMAGIHGALEIARTLLP